MIHILSYELDIILDKAYSTVVSSFKSTLILNVQDETKVSHSVIVFSEDSFFMSPYFSTESKS
jgi:hypothetical protein